MDRIYFDENSGDERGRYDLGIAGSRGDLDRVGNRLKDGVHVMLYDGEDIEVEAVIEFDTVSRRWMALPLWHTRRLASEQTASSRFAG